METPPSVTAQFDQKVFCPYCFHTLTGGDYFCPFCGKQIKDKPLDFSPLKQLSVYTVSILLPPAGLWPAYKYLKSKDPRAKKIGIVCIILTVISVIASAYFLSSLVTSVNTQINDQLNQGLLGM
jgi:hypothetical protein